MRTSSRCRVSNSLKKSRSCVKVIRRHRDSSGHELSWHHPALWLNATRL
jgi:hypothetical protein